MPANKPVQNPIDEMKRLRDSFAASAAKADQQARDLEEQARRARDEARSLRDRTRIMEEAITLMLENEQAQAAEVNLDGLSKKAAAKIGTRRFVFLIDGSGSMNGQPLDNSLKAGASIRDKMTEKAGKTPNLGAVLFGDQKPVSLDLADAQSVERARRGLRSGTDLAPSVKDLAEHLGRNKACHAVIVSDGDLCDNEKSKEELKKLLLENPKATVDFVIIRPAGRSSAFPGAWSGYGSSRGSRTGTMMEGMAESLAAELPAARRPKIVSTQAEGVAAVAAQLLAERLSEAQPRKSKNPAPGK